MSKFNEILLKRLIELMDAATNEAIDFESKATRNQKEIYDNYRDFCFSKIWEEFWEIKHQITGIPNNYCDPDTTYEEDMRAYLEHVKLFIYLETEQATRVE